MARGDAVARVLHLANALIGRSGIRVSRYAREQGLQERTVRRDLQIVGAMWPLEEPSRGSYRLPNRSLDVSAKLSAEEVLAFSVIRQQMPRALVKTRIGRAFESAWHKLAATQQPTTLESRSSDLSFGDYLGVDLSRCHRVIRTIEIAQEKRLAVQIVYHGLRDNVARKRTIEPYELHIDPQLDSLYVVAFCRLRKAVRVFAAHRIVSAKPTSSAASNLAGCSVDVFRHAFRVWYDDVVQRVALRFTGDLVPYVAERRIHRSQRVLHSSRRRFDVEFACAGMQEVLRWLLAYGASVQVLYPAKLVAAHQEELRRSLAQYVKPLRT